MNDDYQASLNRLNQLDGPQATVSSAEPLHRGPQRRPQRVDNRPQWQQIQWFSILFAVVSQLAIWWVYPLIYSKNLTSGQWQHNPLLMTYSLIYFGIRNIVEFFALLYFDKKI